MEKIELEVFSQAVNHGIVKMPERRFPGVVIQGDSLQVLYRNAKGILNSVNKITTDSDLIGEIKILVDDLEARVVHYERILEIHNIELPYVKQK